MIINEPEIEYKNGEVIVSAGIELDNPSIWEMPQKLYFAFPEECGKVLNVDCNPFLYSMLIPAMRLGENIRVLGTVSPRLTFGLQEYQAIFHQAHSQWARHMVEIEYSRFSERELLPPQKRFGATSFSGGIDSTFSCFFLKEEQQLIPYADLKYALFIHGVDNPLNDPIGFMKLAESFRNFLKPQQVELITARTNFILFTQFLLPWTLLPQVPLLSTAMLLRGLIDRFFIPSTYSYNRFTVAGSSFLSDHWVATEEFAVFQLGRHDFLQKLSYVNQIPEYENVLRVCSNKKISLDGNCGHCIKCLRTMVYLALQGNYSKYKSFPQPFSRLYILEWGWKYHTGRVTFINFIHAAWQKKKYDFLLLGMAAYTLSQINHHLRRFLRFVVPEKIFVRWKQRLFVSEEDILAPPSPAS